MKSHLVLSLHTLSPVGQTFASNTISSPQLLQTLLCNTPSQENRKSISFIKEVFGANRIYFSFWWHRGLLQ